MQLFNDSRLSIRLATETSTTSICKCMLMEIVVLCLASASAAQMTRSTYTKVKIRTEEEYRSYTKSRVEMWQELKSLVRFIPRNRSDSSWSTRSAPMWMQEQDYDVMAFYRLARAEGNIENSTPTEFIRAYFDVRRFHIRGSAQEGKSTNGIGQPLAVLETLDHKRVMGITAQGEYVSYEFVSSKMDHVKRFCGR